MVMGKGLLGDFSRWLASKIIKLKSYYSLASENGSLKLRFTLTSWGTGMVK